MPAQDNIDDNQQVGDFFSLEDLVPEELKSVLKETSDDVRDFPDATKDPQAAPLQPRLTPEQDPVKSIEQMQLEDEAKRQQAKEPTQEPLQEPTQEEEEDDDSELDLSDENIDKLLEGDIDAIKKKAGEEDPDDTPFWHENEHYKELLKKASYAGVSQKEVDDIIQEASDAKVINNSKYIQGLEQKANDYALNLERNAKEVERLRKIEKSAHFDMLPETQEKYTKPMQEDISNMRKILDMEGIPAHLPQILGAKNKTEFIDILKDTDLADDDLTRMTNYWRNYRETVFKYNTAKQEANRDLSKFLNHSISEEDADAVLRNSILGFLKSNKKYGYIENAIKDGVQNNEDVTNILATARNNFVNLSKALSNPGDFIHNDESMNSLANYVLEGAHNMVMEKKYYQAQEQLKNREEKLMKVIKAYKKLAQSGNGISDTKRGVFVGKTAAKSSSSKDAEEFKAFLNNEIKIEDIVG